MHKLEMLCQKIHLTILARETGLNTRNCVCVHVNGCVCLCGGRGGGGGGGGEMCIHFSVLSRWLAMTIGKLECNMLRSWRSVY